MERLFEDWFELHGDRHHGDDGALVAGLGRFDGRTIVLIGNQKGRDVKERTRRNFGMANPEGYARRCAPWSSPSGTASRPQLIDTPAPTPA